MKMLKTLFLSFFLAITSVCACYAVEPDEILPNPQLEARARAISSELRCMVCQNESIDESHADLAKDLRTLVREHLKKGETDAQIKGYLVARYGDFILLKPPFKVETLGLWGAPLIVLFGGAFAIYWARRRNRSSDKELAGQPSLSEAESKKLSELLESGKISL
jgi:cytochrome c-type biogenesis protein CcmH